jgi:hypothetical protein
VEHVRDARLQLGNVQAAHLAAAAPAREHEHSPRVDLAVLLRFETEVLPGVAKAVPVPQPSDNSASPVQRPGAGPSVMTNSMSGCAQSAEV